MLARTRVLFRLLASVMSVSLSSCSIIQKDSGQYSGGEHSSINNTHDYWDSENQNGGLTVKGGIIYLGDEEFYGAGVNYYAMLSDVISNGYTLNSVDESLKILSSYDISLIRFNCGVYFSSSLTHFIDNRENYLDAIDYIFSKADELHIGLLPSFMWSIDTIPGYFNEPRSAFGDVNSKTISFMNTYVSTVVTRIKHHKSLFGYEFGNEFMLNCDIPNANENKRFSIDDLNVCYKEFGRTIKSIDSSNRLISSGDGRIRESQYNLHFNNSWDEDTLEERKEIISKAYADTSFNVYSEHLYDYNEKGRAYDISEYINIEKTLAEEIGYPFVIGEWGGAILFKTWHLCVSILRIRRCDNQTQNPIKLCLEFRL